MDKHKWKELLGQLSKKKGIPLICREFINKLRPERWAEGLVQKLCSHYSVLFWLFVRQSHLALANLQLVAVFL